MDREKVIEIIKDRGEIASAVGMQEWVVEKIADHLIENGIGDMTAETAKWDMLCNRLGNIIANGDDCENNCCQGFLDMVNEIKHYDGKYDRQLAAEKHRADVAEEALRLAIIPLQLVKSCDYMPCREKCIRDRNGFCSIDFEHYFKQQAEQRLKERV